MSRDALHTVTLPVLMEAQKHEEIDGWGTLFLAPNHTTITGLQVVREADIWKLLDKRKRSQPEVRQLCGGIALMRQACEARDPERFQHALENVGQWVPHFGKTTFKPLKSKQDWKGTGGIYASLMNNLLQSARLIFWYSVKDESGLRPGLFCPRWETAAYAIFGMGLLRQCPCGELFIPKTIKQNYCGPIHREAYRVAQWRARKSLR